jgi:hypothetical protein
VTDENPSITDSGAFQRHVASVVLGEIGSAGFALSGSGAIREHGITDRPTRDVDLFATSATGPEAFAAALTASEDVLREHGYEVTQTRSTPQFARLLVQSVNGPDPGPVVEIDLAIDWRAEPPAQLAIGPVLALGDAVGNKVAAVYSRGEARDYLDLDAIRQSGRFTDSELLTLAKEHDPGFETAMFTQQLRRVHDLSRSRPPSTASPPAILNRSSHGSAPGRSSFLSHSDHRSRHQHPTRRPHTSPNTVPPQRRTHGTDRAATAPREDRAGEPLPGHGRRTAWPCPTPAVRTGLRGHLTVRHRARCPPLVCSLTTWTARVPHPKQIPWRRP